MRLILHDIVTLGLCATAYALHEQVILDGAIHQNRVKQVAIIGEFIIILTFTEMLSDIPSINTV